MPGGVGLEITILLLLVLAQGVFSAAEMALVSARRAVLEHLAEDGDEAAATAVSLKDAPNEFLATVQIGITFIGTLAGAFGGARFVEVLAPWLRGFGIATLSRYAGSIALAIVVAAITYLTLVVGELVPKRIALRRSEALARRLAGPMRRLAGFARPLVVLLGASTDALLRLVGAREPREREPATEEIGYLLETGMRRGEIRPEEAEMVEEVFRFTERRIRDVMTPRPEIVALPETATTDEVRRVIVTSGYSRIPIYRGSLDHIVGFIHARDLLESCAAGQAPPLRDLLREPLFVPESATVATMLGRLRTESAHLAVVLDEFGITAGILSLEDVLEELVGEITEEHRPEEAGIVQRSEASWLVDGTVGVDDLSDTLEIAEWPDRDRLAYTTLAGFLLARFGRIPRRGDAIEWDGCRFEVVDMDGRRIDQVLVTRIQAQAL